MELYRRRSLGAGGWRKNILKAYAYGESTDGRRVDSRTAELTLNAWDRETRQMILRFSGHEGLALVERLSISPGGMVFADCELRNADTQEVVATRRLVPLVSSASGRSRKTAACCDALLITKCEQVLEQI